MTADRPNLDYLKPENILKLLDEPALTEICIGGVTYPLGPLSAAQWADLDAHGMRIVEHANSGKPLQQGDQDPTRSLIHLIYAGDRSRVLDFDPIRPHVRPEHILAAGKEVMRQRVVDETAKGKTAGEA